jgi:hypothetical protein
MPTTMQCPICQTPARMGVTASVATCPKCQKTFSAAGATAPRKPAAVPNQEEEDTASEGVKVNPYGAVAVALAALATMSATLVGVRLVTIVLVVLGLLVVAVGLVVGKAERERKDRVWFTLGGALNGLVLLVVLFRPGWLNSFWALDRETDEPGPQQMIAVPRMQPSAPGKWLTADDWVDASKDAIRQDKVLVRIESVKSGSRGGVPCLQVHFQIVNNGTEVLKIAAFSDHKPVLTDGSGRSFAFLRPQRRIYGEGPPVFEDVPDQGIELKVDNTKDYLFLFALPPRLDLLKLEVPASAWGREGRCQFDITGVKNK